MTSYGQPYDVIDIEQQLLKDVKPRIIHLIERFSVKGRKTKNHNRHRQSNEPIRARIKTRKTRANKIGFLLIGRESGARYFLLVTKRNNVKPSNSDVTFDTQLKTALY